MAGGLKWQLRLIVLLGEIKAFVPLAMDMYLSAFPQVARSLNVPASQVQMTLAAFILGLALGQLACGPLSDLIGRRRPLLVGCVLYAASGIVCAAGVSLPLLVAARFLMGVGSGATSVVSRAIVRDLFDAKEGVRIYSIMSLVVGIGPVVAPLLGSQLLTSFGWPSIFWALAGFGLLCGVLAFFGLAETLDPRGRGQADVPAILSGFWRICRDARFLKYALPAGAVSGILYAYISGSPFVFLKLHGNSPRNYGLFFAGTSLAIMAFSQLNGWLNSRLGAGRALSVGFGMNLAGCGLLLAAQIGWVGFPFGLIGLFFCIASLGLIMPGIQVAAMWTFGRETAGVASALLGTLRYLMGAGAGLLVGLLANGTAWPMVSVIIACGLAAALWLFFGDRRLKPNVSSS